jgi:ethanolamine utilization protein EutN
MRIGEVIGRVTLSRRHPSLKAARLVIARPLTWAGLDGDPAGVGEELVLFDELGAGPGARVAISEGREAANPFGKTKTPVDAYCACLLDRIDVERMR